VDACGCVRPNCRKHLKQVPRLTQNTTRPQYILVVWLAIGHRERIFLLSGSLLVTEREYSRCLARYWSQRENILIVWLAIGHTERIISLSGSLLVTEREYSHCLARYWSQRENIFVVWLAIGHRESGYLRQELA
jgi:hypothetical protein